MKLIDIGANLSSNQFSNDLDLVIKNALKTNVNDIVLTTVDEASFFKNLEIIENNKNINFFTTWGLHPHYSKNLKSFVANTESFLTNDSIKAIGEFGLDYFRMISSKEEQVKAFEFFIQYSQNKQLPLFLHERDSFSDFISIIHKAKLKNKAVVHCFTGTSSELKSYLDNNLYIGLTGWIGDTRRNSNLLEAIKYLPIDMMMIETDAPYLKPFSIKNKSKRNEPAYLIEVLKEISRIKNIDIELLSETLYNNSIKFFNIEKHEKKLKL